MSNTIAIAREQEVFVVAEVTKGTPVAASASDLIVAAGFGSVTQQPTFTDSPEIVNSRDILERFQDQIPAGDWSFPIIARPSGTAGTAPNGDVLYESLMGTKTTTSGTSVAYSPALTKPSFTIWLKKGHTVFFATGCTVGKADLKIEPKGAVTWSMSGNFMQLGFAGTDALDGTASAADTDITVDDAKKFTVNSMIQLANDDNSGAGYKVTAVNTSTNVIDISPALAVGDSDGAAVTGFLPTGSQTSSPLENRNSVVKIASSTLPVKSASLSITDQPFYIDDEISDDDYPVDYVETQRDIPVDLELYFRENDLKYFHDGLEGNEQAIEILCGSTTGTIMSVTGSKCVLSVPAVTETDPTISLSMPAKILGTNGEDSLTITFK